MKVARKFNLGQLGHQYESLEIEVEGERIDDIILQIDEAWKAYCRAIQAGLVQ